MERPTVLLDRYVLRQFIFTLIFSVGALSIIFIVVDLLESLDDFLDQKASISVILTYYVSYLPNIFKLLLPIGMLLASLFTVGRLSGANEITAMRSGGQSLFRFMVPLLLFGVLLSVGQIYFNGWVVPAANAKKFTIERTYLGRSTGGGSLNMLYFRDSPLRNVSIASYDAAARQARTVTIETYSSEAQPRLLSRIDAPMMKWDTTRAVWTMPTAVQRVFRGDTIVMSDLRNATVPFGIRHDQIISLQRNVEELTFDELKDYISTMKKGGKDTRRQEIEYFGQWAFPVANAIVVLIAVPFASVRRRGGVAVHIAAAMGLSFGYIAFTKIVQSVGVSTDYDAAMVAWSANVLFFLVGVVILLRTRT
ncbi:MAG: LptF/LptG family permease [bacterium]|nr:LptF/LptG family permease [bacterium]